MVKDNILILIIKCNGTDNLSMDNGIEAQSQAWTALKTSILEVLPECIQRNIQLEDSLRGLGANSIDRAEIITLTLSRLKLKIPLIQFAQAKNLTDLLEIFSRSLSQSSLPYEQVSS